MRFGSQIAPQQFLPLPETILCFCQMLGIQNKLPFVSMGSGLWWAWGGFLIFLPCTCLRTGGQSHCRGLGEKANLLETSALPTAEACVGSAVLTLTGRDQPSLQTELFLIFILWHKWRGSECSFQQGLQLRALNKPLEQACRDWLPGSWKSWGPRAQHHTPPPSPRLLHCTTDSVKTSSSPT